MKIAAFNVENLFDRAKAFNEPNKEVAKEILAAAAELNKLMEEDTYTEARKARMLELIEELGLTRKDEGPFVWLRRIRGQFLRRPRDNSEVTIVASGRASWIGWLEHKTEQVNEVAIDNTGRVMRDVNAEVLAVVEAEGRLELSQFVEYVIGKVATEVDAAPEPYRHVMVIDGNDKRGIDVGLMTKEGFPIEEIRSHVDDVNGQAEAIFDRDCPEYAVRTPAGRRIWILPNHLKSKFGGDSPKTRERRKRQAERVAAIYNAIKQRGDAMSSCWGTSMTRPTARPWPPCSPAQT